MARIIDDPVIEARAKARLEDVVKSRIRPESEYKPWMWNVLYSVVVLGKNTQDTASYCGLTNKSVTVYLESIARATNGKYAHRELVEDMRREYNVQLGRDIEGGRETQG